MKDILFKFLIYLPDRLKRKLLMLLPLLFITSVVDIMGFTSIAPVIALIESGNKLQEHKVFQLVNGLLPASFNINELPNLLMLVGILLIVAFILNLVTYVWINIITTRYSEFLTKNILFSYFSKDYLELKEIDASSLCSDVIYEPQRISLAILANLIQLIQRAFSIGLLVIASVWYSPKVTLSIFTFFILLYLIIFGFQKKVLHKVGQDVSKANKRMNQVCMESSHNIQEIKLRGFFKFFIDRIGVYANLFYKSHMTSAILSYYPKLLIELICLIAILYYFYVSGAKGGVNFADVGFYVIIGYKLLPKMNEFFRFLSKVKSHQFAFESLAPMISNGEQLEQKINALPKAQKDSSFQFDKTLEIKNMDFSFGDKKLFENYNFAINKGEFVGIYGRSGNGKSTFINILTGLIPMQKGQIVIDGKEVPKAEIKNYQSLFSFVPQEPFLMNATVADNIAFGFEGNIESNELENAAKLSSVDNVIENLPSGFNTLIGEDGVNVSGGEKQRITIARAMFFNNPILILDEATSSLDKETEQKIMENITSNLKGKYTILMISHNPGLHRYFDRVVEL